MPAPTSLTYFDSANWFSPGTGAKTVVASWAAGDDIYVIGVTSDAAHTFATPTASGLTFALVTSKVGTASSTNAYIWKATAASPGSSVTISATLSTSTSGPAGGISALAAAGSTGVGGIATPTASTAKSVSLIRAGANSAVLYVAGDWSAGTVTTTWTPAGQTTRTAISDGTNDTTYVATWPDEGAPATVSYGQTGTGGGNWTKLAIEIKGSGGAAPPPPKPRMVAGRAPALSRW